MFDHLLTLLATVLGLHGAAVLLFFWLTRSQRKTTRRSP